MERFHDQRRRSPETIGAQHHARRVSPFGTFTSVGTAPGFFFFLVMAQTVLASFPKPMYRGNGVEVYWYTLASSDTTVKISRNTLSHLERLREELHARSLDETVRELIKSHRHGILGGAFGVDKGRLKPFREEDRGEDR